jgi:hypothetical protein
MNYFIKVDRKKSKITNISWQMILRGMVFNVGDEIQVDNDVIFGKTFLKVNKINQKSIIFERCKKVIAITYDGWNESKYLINEETETYVYFTNGWHGGKMRYDKLNQIIEQPSQNGTWVKMNDIIIQVDIY